MLPSLKPVSRRFFAALDAFFKKFGYRIQRRDIPSHFEPLLYRRLAKSPDFFFIQIGANDGISSDPIRDFVTQNQVAGLALEPLSDVFERLVANYRNYPKVTPVRTAIHRTDKSVEIHRVDPARVEELGEWTRGIGSVKAEHHALSRTASSAMVTESVPGMTLGELVSTHKVDHIDLLQIDTEGYDAEILKMIDFAKCKPAIIRFEHGLPDGIMTKEEFKECTGLLLEQGYYLLMEDYDTVAYLPDRL